jgi:hypothetical protein
MGHRDRAGETLPGRLFGLIRARPSVRADDDAAHGDGGTAGLRLPPSRSRTRTRRRPRSRGGRAASYSSVAHARSGTRNVRQHPRGFARRPAVVVVDARVRGVPRHVGCVRLDRLGSVRAAAVHLPTGDPMRIRLGRGIPVLVVLPVGHPRAGGRPLTPSSRSAPPCRWNPAASDRGPARRRPGARAERPAAHPRGVVRAARGGGSRRRARGRRANPDGRQPHPVQAQPGRSRPRRRDRVRDRPRPSRRAPHRSPRQLAPRCASSRRTRHPRTALLRCVAPYSR